MRHKFRRMAFLCSFALVALPLCAQGLSSNMTARGAVRLLDQGGWGPSATSIVQLEKETAGQWIAQQIAMNVSDLPDQPLLASNGNTNTDLGPVQEAFFQNALSQPDVLRQRVAFALSEMWVVSAVTIKPAYAFPPYWRIFRDRAFGNYRDLIQAVTLSPAMGTYLTSANNNKASNGNSANENYAREVMQLFTIGLNQLNPDGTLVLDSAGNPIPTYNNAIVTQVAKVFTGWTYPVAPGATAKNNNPGYYFGQMYAVESEHDQTAKTIFNNITIPAGQTAEQDLNSFLDAIMSHPSMAPFVSKQLIQHLVTSNPSPAYVERVSKVFSNDGTGTAGNLAAVVTAILTDPEARAGDMDIVSSPATFGHMREPVLFMANLLNGLNATLGASSAIYNQATQLGQQLFYPPSVFSYFSPENRIEGGLLAPEFQLYTTQTASTRADIVNSILYGSLDKSTTVNLAPFNSAASSIESLLDYIDLVFMHGAMPFRVKMQAYNAAAAQSSTANKVKAALYVVLTSGEYQIVQ